MLRRLLHITNRRNHHQCQQNRGSEPGRYGDLPLQCSRLPEHDLDWWMGPPAIRRILDNLCVHSSKCTRDQQSSVPRLRLTHPCTVRRHQLQPTMRCSVRTRQHTSTQPALHEELRRKLQHCKTALGYSNNTERTC